MPEAFPAVTVPSLANAGRSRAMDSRLTSSRKCSSVLNSTVFFLTVTSMGVICSSK